MSGIAIPRGKDNIFWRKKSSFFIFFQIFFFFKKRKEKEKKEVKLNPEGWLASHCGGLGVVQMPQGDHWGVSGVVAPPPEHLGVAWATPSSLPMSFGDGHSHPPVYFIFLVWYIFFLIK